MVCSRAAARRARLGEPPPLGVFFAGSFGLRLAALGTRLALALGGLALAFDSLALDLLPFLGLDFLGLRLLRGRADRREHRLGIVEKRDAPGNAQVGDAEAVSDHHRRDVELEVVGHLHREGLDTYLAVDLAEDAAFLLAGRLADELDDDVRLDRLVEPNLVKVDVEKAGAGRIQLVVLDDRVVGLLLALENDIEDRVQPVVASQRLAELALLYAERMCLVAAPVENARDEAFLTQAPRGRAPARLPCLHLQLDSLSCHFRRRSVPTGSSLPQRRARVALPGAAICPSVMGAFCGGSTDGA